jgi:predicted lipid-binding transport protein (Tim44 family)
VGRSGSRRLGTLFCLIVLGAAIGCPKHARPASPPSSPGAVPSGQPAKPAPAEPAKPPPNPKLLVDDAAQRLRAVQKRWAKCEALASAVAERDLTDDQKAALESARHFLDESRKAAKDGDVDRAGVLADKACVLLEDLDAATSS